MSYQKQCLVDLPADGSRIKVALVYQCGLANVFRVARFQIEAWQPDNRNAVRLLQADFAACENFARGMAKAGAVVFTYGCNKAGDIAESTWSEDLESQPFSDKFRPVFYTVGGLAEFEARGYANSIGGMEHAGRKLWQIVRELPNTLGTNADNEHTYKSETAPMNQRRERRIAKRLSVAQWQISRAIRELQRAQAVEKKNAEKAARKAGRAKP
jgi:hypothetical protein